ncbi:MAG: fimbrillin family protein [Prevotella sp.]|nr:fimbrillin family protein [Prevotella sp.]
MKKTFKYITLAAAAMLTAACSQEDLTTSYLDDPNAVRITAQVGEGEVSGGFVTRSTPAGTTETEDKFVSGDRISVSTADQGPVVYAFDGSAWSPENGKFLKWTSSPMTFTAYYPVADGVDENTFVVPTDQTEANKIATADYMTYSASVARAQGHNGVNLQMQRKMARIVINPILQTQFDEYTVTAVTVHGNTAGYSDGNLTTEDVAVNAYKHTNGNFYALLSPTTANNDNYFIDVTVTKGDLSVTLHAKGIPTTTAGNSYTVKLTVGRNVANITGITIKEWTSGATIGTDEEAELVPYVTFSAENDQTFTMDFKPDNYAEGVFSLGEDEYFEYSVGGGKWTRFTSTVSDVAFGGANGNLRLRGKSSKGTATKPKCYSTIKFTTSNSPVQCTGDIRTLIDYENYATASTENARFIKLFKNNTQLTSAPELPATTLADHCYEGMFRVCTSLATAPVLPATTLAASCYFSMFVGCSALTTAHELPAKTLTEHCYDAMFFECTSLTTAPELPATTLAQKCYFNMFRGCTSLTTAVLPAKTLVAGCYQMMFYDCTNLSNLTMLATDVSATDETNTPCTSDWLYNAGSSASTRTLTLANKGIHDTLFPTNASSRWKEGAEGTTVIYMDNSSPST